MKNNSRYIHMNPAVKGPFTVMEDGDNWGIALNGRIIKTFPYASRNEAEQAAAEINQKVRELL